MMEMPDLPEDDCFAVRLAVALDRRFGQAAPILADRKLSEALRQRNTIKADLYLAINVIFRDHRRVFSHSRGRSRGG